MIIFVDDDHACRYWLTHHRRGYAVEGMRNRKRTRLVLHGADCRLLKDEVRRGRATTHHRWIACSLQRDELTAWCSAEYALEPTSCETCLPMVPEPPSEQGDHHLTRVARDILDFMLDVSIIHLEPDAKPYDLRIADIAQCLHKTPGQLAAALERLAQEGLIVIDEPERRHRMQTERRGVYPTVSSMRTLPYYAEWEQAALDAEVAKLRGDD